jgi:D-3-phosphoglycerate dehydrogenase / 2-oxoglutarate reductase
LQAFGSRVVGYDPGLHASDSLWSRWNITPIGLRELIEQCDGVCLLLNYFSRYRGLIGDRYLQHCKPEQVLVSLSSALVLEESALAQVLSSGRMAAAWLDSVEPGMTSPGRPLHQIDSLQVTPRVASSTLESHLRASWEVARRIDEILNERSRAGLVAGSGLSGGLAMPPSPGARVGYPGGPAPG